jgi:carboxymethylenebutenolidase
MTSAGLVPYARWRTSYASDGLELPGFWLLPAGAGPHPAVVFCHGSAGLMPLTIVGLEALRALGYAVFAAVRRGHHEQPGVLWRDRVTAPWGSAEMQPQLVDALRDELRDVRAAVAWVAARPEVDAGRLALVGSSYGGVMTVLAAAEPGIVRAGVSFAGPSMTWPDAPALQAELLAAARAAAMPLFLAQAVDDNSLDPTYAIGAELARNGRPHEVRVYPAGGHGLFGGAVQLWQRDIEAFLERWLAGAAS